MNPLEKTILKLLKESQERHIIQHDSLLRDYREYQSYFRKEDGTEAKHKANLRFYCEMMDLLEVGPYEEGRFSLEHESLSSRMEKNKADRKRIIEQLKDIKGQIKEVQVISQTA